MATRESVGWVMEDHGRIICAQSFAVSPYDGAGSQGPVPGLDPPLRQGEPIGWGVSQADQKGGAHSIDAPKGAGPDNAAMESFFASLKKRYWYVNIVVL